MSSIYTRSKPLLSVPAVVAPTCAAKKTVRARVPVEPGCVGVGRIEALTN